MSRRGLEFLAVVLAFLIVVVLLAGFDNLPRPLRADIKAEAQQLPQTASQFQADQAEVTRDLSSDPDLFRAHNMSTVFPSRFQIAAKELDGAQRDSAELDKLLKANRRQDRDQAERLLTEERALRTGALNEASAMQTEAQHWLDLKRNLPTELTQMQSDHETLDHWDFAPITTTIDRAETDWPAKKSDLAARLAALRAIPADGDQAWQASDAMWRQAEAKNYTGLDYATLLTSAETLHNDVAILPVRTAELQSLDGQLYTTWDKILIDLRDRKSGGMRDYEEEIKLVRTKLVDASGTKGDTTSEENWVEVPKATYAVAEKNVGMAIAHKPAGKYDSEADEVAQPAGFAYMAPPGQRNGYGYWEQRDGGSFWVWYGQYALLRDLLWGHSYQPIPSREWEYYRTARSSGQTYYGHDEGGAPKYGTHGTFTQQHYGESRYVRSAGGFGSSKYATGGYKSGQGTVGKTFGSSRSPGSTFRPRSAPSFGRGFRMPSAGRRFGRRR